MAKNKVNTIKELEKEFIKKWLEEHEYCVIATSRKDKPWAATVNYGIDDDLNIYISTNPNSLKFKNLLNNPVVCLVIDGQTREGTLQIQGIAELLELKKKGDPNIKIKPKFLIFKSKEESGELKDIFLKIIS